VFEWVPIKYGDGFLLHYLTRSLGDEGKPGKLADVNRVSQCMPIRDAANNVPVTEERKGSRGDA